MKSNAMKHAARSGPDVRSVDRCHDTRTRRRRERRRVGEDSVIVRSAAAIDASAYRTVRTESDNIATFQLTSHPQKHPDLILA